MRVALSLFLFVLVLNVLAQLSAPGIEWQRCYGGSAEDQLQDMKPTPDGGYILVGRSLSTNGQVTNNQGSSDVWVVKVDPSGIIQWQKTYGGSDGDNGVAILLTDDGGYLVAANTVSVDGDVSISLGSTDIWLLKLASDGTLEWDRSYGGSGIDGAFDLIATNNGYLIIGHTNSTDGMVSQSFGYGDIWLVMIDPLGALLWERSYGGAMDDFGTSIDLLGNGDIVICGYAGGSGLYSVFAARIDQNGNTIWEDVFGGSSFDGARRIRVSPADEIHIVGMTFSTDGDIIDNQGESDLWLLNLDGEGEVLSSRTYGGTHRDSGNDILFTPDGGLLILANSRSNDGDLPMNYGDLDTWVIRTDADGNILWQQVYGGSAGDSGLRLMLHDDGKIVFGGNTRSNNIDVSGNHGDLDFWLVQLASDPVGIHEQAAWVQADLHPNPTNGTVTVTVNTITSQNVMLDLVDAAGRITPLRGNYHLNAGENQLTIDLAQQAPGIYYLVIHGEGQPVRLPVVKM